MIKSASNLFLSTSRQQRKAADRQRRHDLAIKPTPDEMLQWLEGVGRGYLLVLVDKMGVACVKAIERDYAYALQPSCRPAGVGAFRKLMKRMLAEFANAPEDVRQAAQSLGDLLAEDAVKTDGVVRTDLLLTRLRALNDALQLHRQAQQDRKGVDLQEEAPTGCGPKSSSSTMRSRSVNRPPAPLIRRGGSFRNLRRDLVQSAERPLSLSTTTKPTDASTPPKKPKDETSE